ncbi:MAG: WD40 repeat domain-containing protein, partial [Bacteroidota bacterium]
DGNHILTGSWDYTAKLWERASGRDIQTFQGHTSNVSSVAFSPDGNYILTGSWDNTAKLWERESGRDIQTFQGHTSYVYSVAFSPDGNYILTGSRDRTAKLWDRASGRDIQSFHGHTSPISSVAFSSDRNYILTGSEDNTAKLWNGLDSYMSTFYSYPKEELKEMGMEWEEEEYKSIGKVEADYYTKLRAEQLYPAGLGYVNLLINEYKAYPQDFDRELFRKLKTAAELSRAGAWLQTHGEMALGAELLARVKEQEDLPPMSKEEEDTPE